MRQHRSLQGFAMIELLMVLGIGVLIMTAAWVAFAQRNEDMRVQQSFEAIDHLSLVADSSYASSEGYFRPGPLGDEDITMTALQETMEELPESVVDQGGGNHANPWGGVWAIEPANTTTGNRDLMVMTLTNVPTGSCVQLAGLVAPRMYDTLVNGELVGLTPARTLQAGGRNAIRSSQVISLCQEARNTMVFRRLKPVDYTMLRDQPMHPEMLSPRELTDYVPVFVRVEDAMTAREAAQVALP